MQVFRNILSLHDNIPIQIKSLHKGLRIQMIFLENYLLCRAEQMQL